MVSSVRLGFANKIIDMANGENYIIKQHGKTVTVKIVGKMPVVLRNLLKERGYHLNQAARIWSGKGNAKELENEFQEIMQAELERRANNIVDGYGLTLCWQCKRNAADCPWLSRDKPVQGWEAKKTRLLVNSSTTGQNRVHQNHSYYIDSYVVQQCPLYQKERQPPKRGYEQCYSDLAKAVVVAAIKDWKTAGRGNSASKEQAESKEALMHFFQSSWCGVLLSTMDGVDQETLIERIKEI